MPPKKKKVKKGGDDEDFWCVNLSPALAHWSLPQPLFVS